MASDGSGRVIGWFSCGATSAVACKLATLDHPGVVLVRIVLGGEHADNDRFHADCERWIGRPIERLLPPRYRDHFEVAESGFINGPQGAKCTAELKRRTRELYQRPDDAHVFGFDADERDRADRYEASFGLKLLTPLLDAGLTKGDCKAVIEKAGIELPAMYKLGYANNNCVGCWKGGMGYWNRIRVDFPAVFARAAAVEQRIGATALRHRSGPQKGQRLPLLELDPAAGRFADDEPVSCGPLCELTTQRFDPEPEVISC